MESATPGHLTVNTSGRGFDGLPPIPSEYGGEVSVYESSAAGSPHIWLRAEAPIDLNRPNGPTHEAAIHPTAENAWRLAEQLMFLVRNHYQGDESPEGDLDAIRDELREHVANLGDKQPWDNRVMFDRVLAALEAHAGTSKAEG
jgi:hypothetical protein